MLFISFLDFLLTVLFYRTDKLIHTYLLPQIYVYEHVICMYICLSILFQMEHTDISTKINMSRHRKT